QKPREWGRNGDGSGWTGPRLPYIFFWGERDSYLLLTTTNNKGTIDKRGNVYFERKERGAWG
ncbi:MAG: hypothetical protein ACK559_21170, partial [bacterium]